MRTKTLEQNTAQDFAGLQVDQLQKLRDGNITFEQVKWFNNLSYEQRQTLMGKQFEKEIILRLISGTAELKLDAVDGKQTIYNSKGVFVSIDSCFKNHIANSIGFATKETVVDVYENVKNATFAQMFSSFGSDLEKLCLTQHQILNFISKYKNLLFYNKSLITLFLFEIEKKFFFVARVRELSDGLDIVVYRLKDEIVWKAENLRHIVVPQLNA